MSVLLGIYGPIHVTPIIHTETNQQVFLKATVFIVDIQAEI